VAPGPGPGKDRLTKDIALYSSGIWADDEASIKVSGVEHSRHRYGLNIVVLSGDGAVLKSTIFDSAMLWRQREEPGSKINLCTRLDPPGNLVKKPSLFFAQPSNLTE
jgi:hypothetical protein